MSCIKFTDAIDLQNKIDEFYTWCKENKKNITVTRLAWFLGVNKNTLANWINSKDIPNLNSSIDTKTKEQIINILEDAYNYIESECEERLYNKNSVSGSIFALKNLYSWKDKQEIDTTISTNTAIQKLSDEELRELINQAKE